MRIVGDIPFGESLMSTIVLMFHDPGTANGWSPVSFHTIQVD